MSETKTVEPVVAIQSEVLAEATLFMLRTVRLSGPDHDRLQEFLDRYDAAPKARTPEQVRIKEAADAQELKDAADAKANLASDAHARDAADARTREADAVKAQQSGAKPGQKPVTQLHG